MIKKSLCDKRNYRLITLSNSLKALLVQDNEADNSSASLGVRVGAYSDPKEFPGLAHFCEHMLFMGTKKYPKIDDFSEYLSANDGYSNAFTDTHSTVYKFECSNKAFLPALDRFSQFFISPLFERSAVKKELEAIESENQKNLQNDSWRGMQLIRSESNPGSINHLFATGNIHTLNPNNNIDEPRDALVNFYNNYYHACKMNLVVDSPIELDQIEKVVRDYFKGIPKGDGKNINYFDENNLSYNSNNLKRYYVYQGVEDKNKLKFQWFLESTIKYYKEKPLDYASILFGHECQNTLYSSLIKDNLITDISAGSYNIKNVLGTFSIIMNLTDKGLLNINQIIQRTLKYIKLIQSKPINKEFYDEYKHTNTLSFDYKSRENPVNYTETLAYTMDNYSDEHILSGEYLNEVYDENLIKLYLNKLNIENMNIYLQTRNNDFLKECNLSEKWYGTKYKYENIDKNIIDDLNKFNPNTDKICNHNLGFPQQNKFIPKNLELNKSLIKLDYPKLLLKENNCELWYKPDLKFLKPKANIYCQIYLDKSILTFVEYESIAYTWNLVVKTKMKDLSYMAREANLKFELNANDDGIILNIKGFNDSIKPALEQLINLFVSIINSNNIVNDPDTYEIFKMQLEKQIKEMDNFYLKTPYTIALAYHNYLKINPSATPDSKLLKLRNLYTNKENNCNDKEIDKSKIMYFVKNYFKKARYVWIIQGNISEEDAKDLNNTVIKLSNTDNLKNNEVFSYRTVDQNNKTCYSYVMHATNKNETNSCIVSSFSWDCTSNLRQHVTLELINNLITEKFFDSLRTNQGLGYIVTSFLSQQRNIHSIVFLVQSNNKSPEYIWRKINEFLTERKEYMINQLDDKVFSEHVEALINNKQKKFINLSEEVNFNYNQIKKRQFLFNSKELMVKELQSLTKQEVIKCFEKLFFESVRRLDIMFVSDNRKEEQNTLQNAYLENLNKNNEDLNYSREFIYCIEDYKRKNKLHADFYSNLDNVPKF